MTVPHTPTPWSTEVSSSEDELLVFSDGELRRQRSNLARRR